MKHQHAIVNLRLANMKQGIVHVETYLGSINKMLSEKEINVEAILNEVEEIQCLIQWVKEQ